MFFLLLLSHPSCASTLVLRGGMEGSIDVSHERVFSVPPGGLSSLSFRFATPASFESPTVRQSYSGHRLDFSPKPDSIKVERDSIGNPYTVVKWTGLKRDAVVRESYAVDMRIKLDDVKSSAPFPLKTESIPFDEKRFLAPTPLVQSDSPEIMSLAKRLSGGAASEQAAVGSVLNWVVDNIKYKSPIPDYGALWTLKEGRGNCQNFSHLSIALLRSIGIPARIVGGVALGRPWKVPLENGSLVQSIGQGGHAWLEVWYPDLGWVPYDAQQSHLFVSPRHIKQTVGLDSNDINDSWRASPLLPPFNESVSAEFVKDNIGLALKDTRPSPINYIVAGSLAPGLAPPPPPLPPVIEPPEGPEGEAEFGNIDFPPLIDLFVKLKGDEGKKTFDKETSEYVTGEVTFAQSFRISRGLRLSSVSLAMHKFGGRLGSLWVDIVRDDGGRPSMDGVRSLPLSLDTVSYHPGYKWFDFRFSPAPDGAPVLEPGRYWIVLRRSKDAIVNWFYIPGNPYGEPGEARSTAKGIDWSNIMNYDFNFKVRGVFLRP